MELQQAVAFTLSVCFHFQCVQGLGMGYLKSRFSEMQLIKGGVFVLIWAYLLLVSGTSKFSTYCNLFKGRSHFFGLIDID